jgi:hypothetical protein
LGDKDGEEADVDHRDAWWISFLEDPTYQGKLTVSFRKKK